jgi:ABC-type antimicrobial peptide transport system permease subunit
MNSVEIVSEAIYETDEDVPGILVPLETLKEIQFEQDKGTVESTVWYYANNPQGVIDSFTALDSEADVVYPYTVLKAEYMQNKIIVNIGYIMFAGTFLGASAIASYFVLRSSLLSRIYEVSVYRALGTPKKDLRKIFLIETLILTVFTSLGGYLLTSYFLVKLQAMTEGFFEVVKVTPLSFAAGLVIIFMTNILSGIIPVSNLLRKTPAEIISKYDF